MVKKILIISRSFYPKNSPRSFRTTELAKELAINGHEVSVLLPKDKHSDETEVFAKRYNIIIKYYGVLTWPSFRYSKIFGDWTRKLGRLFFLLFQYPDIEVFFKIKRYLKNIENQYDLLISIAAPHQNHWAVASIQSKYKIAKVWVADCGDPFMGNKLDTIRPPFYFNYLENQFLSQADFVSVPTLGAVSAYKKKYHHKFKIIPQGFDFNDINLGNWKPENKTITFAYAGSISQKGVRSPHNFINYLLNRDKEFKFYIFSSQTSILKNLADKSGGRLILRDSINRNKLLQMLSKMDFLVNFDNGVRTASPSKLIDYTLTKRPILNINPFKPEENIIEEFLHKKFQHQFVVNDIQQYNIKNVAQSFLDCFYEK